MTNQQKQQYHTDDEERVLINFRIPVSFRKEFRIAAAQLDMTQSDLLQLIFEEWKKRHNLGMQ